MAAEPVVDLKKPTEAADKQPEKEEEKGLGNDACVLTSHGVTYQGTKRCSHLPIGLQNIPPPVKFSARCSRSSSRKWSPARLCWNFAWSMLSDGACQSQPTYHVDI